MRYAYYIAAVAATLFALSLLGLQIVGGLEYTEGASAYGRWSMVGTMITVAALPMFIDVTWRASRGIALALAVGFVLFLAYSLPAAIGRIGEVREVKALAAGDAAQLQADIAAVNRTLATAQPQMEAECLGAPDPLPLDRNRWPECRRKRGTVTALLNDRARLTDEIRKLGSARVGDTSSQTVAWMLSTLGVSEQTIRRGSGIAFAVGLEVIIASLLAAVLPLVRAGMATRPRQATVPAVESTPRQLRTEAPRGEPGVKAYNRDEAFADLTLLLQAGHRPESQDWLTERWGVTKGATSKWLAHWEAEGRLPARRVTDGRFKTLVPS